MPTMLILSITQRALGSGFSRELNEHFYFLSIFGQPHFANLYDNWDLFPRNITIGDTKTIPFFDG